MDTAVSDIPERCVLVGPQSAQFFTFSDRLLTIPHAIYLVFNKNALNWTKITGFLHILYYYLRTCHQLLPKFELTKLFGLEDEKSGKYRPKCSEGFQCYPEFEVFDTFFSSFMLYRMSAKSILPPKMTCFSLDLPR